jgi:hypothetical protein
MEQTTKRLISVGIVQAHRAETVHAGDLLMWNYGYVECVDQVIPRGETMLVLKGFSVGRYGDLITEPGVYGGSAALLQVGDPLTPCTTYRMPAEPPLPEYGRFERVIKRSTLVVKVALQVEAPYAPGRGIRRQIDVVANEKVLAQ